MIKLLIVHDTEVVTGSGKVLRWAYANRSHALKSHAPSDFIVDRICNDAFVYADAVSNYDVIFYMDYMGFTGLAPQAISDGSIGKFVVSFNKDSRSRQSEWACLGVAPTVIVNNEDRWSADGGRHNACCISNGVDTDFWKRTRPISERNRVLWCGSSSPSKMKNYNNVIIPLGQMLKKEGLDFSFRPIDNIDESVFDPEEQREWYNTGDVVVCGASSEGGGPSYLMEAAACGCIPVSTNVGSVPEWAGDCGVVTVKATAESLFEGVMKAREDKEVKSNMSVDGMLKNSYGPPGFRAEYFYQVFRIVANGRLPESFTYREIKPSGIKLRLDSHLLH